MDRDYFSSSILSSADNPVDFREYEDKISEPLEHMVNASYKMLKILLKAANLWFRIPDDKYKMVVELLRSISNVALMIDDIIDDGRIREGAPTSHVIFGLPATLMCCEYANFKFIKDIAEISRTTKNDDFFDFFLQSFLDIYKGQAAEMIWRENSTCPSIEEYVMMVNGKATTFVEFSFKLMQLFSENKKDYSSITPLLGMFFQIHNDCQNLFKPESENTYELFADDLTEGKFTFPLIYAIKQLKNEEVEDILRQRPTDLETKRKCVAILRDIGVAKYCQNVLNEAAGKIKSKLKELGGNPIMEMAVDLVTDYNEWLK